MQPIKIYDQIQKKQNYQATNQMVIGVHSYASFLSQLSHKKNIKILIIGSIQEIVENILWNQFYSYTLLKDIQRTLFSQAELKNSFLKINGKTYRLNQSLQWTTNQKIGPEIIKYPYFSIECFMIDSSIKFISLDIGDSNNTAYDIVFQYFTYNKSMKSTLNTDELNSKRKRIEGIQPSKAKTKIDNNFKSTVAIKSLFQQQKNKQKQNCNKYLTQKKNWNQKPKQSIKCQYQKKRSNTKTHKPKIQQKQNDLKSLKQSSDNFSSSGLKMSISNYNQRDSLTANILHKKEQKIKEYEQILQKKQKQFEQQIQNIQKNHEQQVSAIKLQVKEVLSNYKKKNKELRKQNQCLMQINHKLSITNKKLEQKVQQLSEKIQILVQGQQRIQKNNFQYSLKFNNIQDTNKKLIQKLGQQQSYFKSQISEKDKLTYELKTKYDRLLGNIKLVTAEEKQNMI